MPDRAGDAISATYNISYENLMLSLGMKPERGMGGMLRASQDPLRSSLLLLSYGIALFFLSLWLADRREMV
jgi:hypothetical protein